MATNSEMMSVIPYNQSQAEVDQPLPNESTGLSPLSKESADLRPLSRQLVDLQPKIQSDLSTGITNWVHRENGGSGNQGTILTTQEGHEIHVIRSILNGLPKRLTLSGKYILDSRELNVKVDSLFSESGESEPNVRLSVDGKIISQSTGSADETAQIASQMSRAALPELNVETFAHKLFQAYQGATPNHQAIEELAQNLRTVGYGEVDYNSPIMGK